MRVLPLLLCLLSGTALADDLTLSVALLPGEAQTLVVPINGKTTFASFDMGLPVGVSASATFDLGQITLNVRVDARSNKVDASLPDEQRQALETYAEQAQLTRKGGLLAQPTLVMTPGQKAEFVTGSQVRVLDPQGDVELDGKRYRFLDVGLSVIANPDPAN